MAAILNRLISQPLRFYDGANLPALSVPPESNKTRRLTQHGNSPALIPRALAALRRSAILACETSNRLSGVLAMLG